MRSDFDYSEEELRIVDLTLSSSANWIQQQDKVKTTEDGTRCSG